MTIVDPDKRLLASQRHTRFQICYVCHSRNNVVTKTCRKCGSHELRKKHDKRQIKKG